MSKCINCGEDISINGHYVPPSLGDAGFFSCHKDKAKPDTRYEDEHGNVFVNEKLVYSNTPAPPEASDGK